MQPLITAHGFVPVYSLNATMRKTCSWLPQFIHGFGHFIRYQYGLTVFKFYITFIHLFILCVFSGQVRGQLSGISSPSTTGA